MAGHCWRRGVLTLQPRHRRVNKTPPSVTKPMVSGAQNKQLGQHQNKLQCALPSSQRMPAGACVRKRLGWGSAQLRLVGKAQNNQPATYYQCTLRCIAGIHLQTPQLTRQLSATALRCRRFMLMRGNPDVAIMPTARGFNAMPKTLSSPDATARRLHPPTQQIFRA